MPWYHVLVHGADHTTYVAERNLEPFEGTRISLVQFFLDSKLKLQAERLETYLSLPIDERNRRDFEEALKRQRG